MVSGNSFPFGKLMPQMAIDNVMIDKDVGIVAKIKFVFQAYNAVVILPVSNFEGLSIRHSCLTDQHHAVLIIYFGSTH